jgi:hypothetical protein
LPRPRARSPRRHLSLSPSPLRHAASNTPLQLPPPCCSWQTAAGASPCRLDIVFSRLDSTRCRLVSGFHGYRGRHRKRHRLSCSLGLFDTAF